MKKFISLIIIASLLNPVGVTISIADFADMKDKVETTLDVWVGGSLSETDNSVVSSFPDENTTYPAGDAAKRIASNKAAEYHSLDSSPSGGFLFKDAHAPNRIHLEFDFEDEDSWFGDLRYSYKDYFLLRVIPRRLYHNLENITLYDYNPVLNDLTTNTNATNAASTITTYTFGENTGTDVENLDANVRHSLTIDIDEYRLRLKTPNFPLHLYSNGEVVRRKGTMDSRFQGGNAYRSMNIAVPFGDPAPAAPLFPSRGRIRVSDTAEVDSEKKEFSIGTNAHLGPIEFDISHQIRKFKSDAPAQTYLYDYSATPQPHHITPELDATTNTLKLHTSHSGRIFASTTFSEIKKTNETSNGESVKAEAKNTLGYGELVWMPASYISFTTKYRHQKNEATAPASTTGLHYDGTTSTYELEPGVESTTGIASFGIRYSQIPSTNIKLAFTNKIKEVEDRSAVSWGRPLKQTRNSYEFGITNWAIPKVRLTAKLGRMNIHNDFGYDLTLATPIDYNPHDAASADRYTVTAINNDPDNRDYGSLGIAWVMSPKVVAFISGKVTKEEGEHILFAAETEHHEAEALRQQYLASIGFIINEKLSITPSYTYILDEQKRDMVWERVADPFVDHDNRSLQEAHNVALSIMATPTKKLTINTTFDYTATESTMEPTSPFNMGGTLINTAEIAAFSHTKTQEYGVGLDTDYDIGQGWGIGVDVQYIDWKDDSFDNPSDSTYIGGLVKITKTIF